MRIGLFLPLLFTFAASASITPPIEVGIVGTAENHQLTWTTRLDYNYQVEASPDLENWVDTGIAEPGTGSSITYGLMSTADKMFYRIKESEDLFNGGFLALPTQHQEVDLIDGVCFAFNMEVFDPLPAKIRIYQREYESGDPWVLIGAITEFATRDNVTFVRGSVVWIPPAEGEYEVQAVAVDATGTTMGSAVRHVIVGANDPPTITITGLTGNPTLPSPTALDMIFDVTVSDPDGDDITRVEFYDNGVLIGTDREAPFGDWITDIQDFNYEFLKRTHSITAKAYDSRGAIGETAQPFVVQVTGGNARPTLAITSPASNLIVPQGQVITIAYSVADPDGSSDLAEVRATNLRNFEEASDDSAPFENLTLDTTTWEPGSHTVVVRSFDAQGAYSYAHTFTVYVQQATGQTFAERLVANLIDPLSVAASNETFDGEEASSGEFEDGLASGLQMDEGILLGTGLFSYWNGGNVSGGLGYSWGRPGDDRLRDRLSGGDPNYTTNDAAALEFDLFCENGQLEFEFQFGSEEYLEYVEQYNDGFLITVDDVIVSLTPDCLDIVSVDAIHDYVSPSVSTIGLEVPAVREHLYMSNPDDIAPTVAPSDLDQIVEYDGMTIKLRGHVLVEAGRTYRVRAVIADAKDYVWDSGIFIEKNSIRTIEPNP
jgi:hypothetical protein